MLSGCSRKGLGEIGEKEMLQDFHGRGPKGDWAVAGRLVSGFSRFGDGDDISFFLYGGDVSMGSGEIKEAG
jgi:hypothetical protein